MNYFEKQDIGMTVLQIPPDVQMLESPGSIYWFGEDGIVYSISRKSTDVSLDDVKRIVEDFQALLDGKKICLLIDVTHTSESTRETRDYVAAEFPKFVKAIAMVSKSALGKMLANLFFTIKSQPYPTKMFNTMEEAKQWLRQYL